MRYLITALTLFLSYSLPVAAEDSDQRLETIQTEIKTLSESYTQNQKTREALYRQLKQQSQSISKLNRNLLKLKQQLSSKTKQLDELKIEQKQYRQTQAKQLTALNEQLRSAFINAKPSYLQVMLSQQDPSKLSRSGTYFKYFHQARQQQLDEINNSLQTLTNQQQQLIEAQNQLESLRIEQEQQHALLEQQNQKQRSTVKQLDNDLQAKSVRIAELQAEEKALKALLASLAKPTEKKKRRIKQHSQFSKNKGSLIWPIEGKIVARYGSSRNVGKLKWQGIMIKASSGQEVIAPAEGTVVFSGWLRGFGLLLIIDHGDKYMTLYGNNQTLLKEVGENVSAGDIIALSGEKGIKQHAGLYFELRHQGSPKNPAHWLNKQS